MDCPFHGGAICSLCCTLDARCNGRCKPVTPALLGAARWLTDLLPLRRRRLRDTRYGLFASITGGFLAIIGAAFLLIHQQVALTDPASSAAVARGLTMAFCMLALVVGIAAWLHVLARESRVRALREAERQTRRLTAEIAAHERTDAELQRAKDDAVSANEAKSRYVVGISHELRTPLNAILGYAQLMEADPTIPSHRQASVGVIRRSAEHLGGLIEGLLDISRIEAGRLEVYRDQIRLHDCLDHIAAIFRMQAASKALTFQTDFNGDLPRLVSGDEKRLRQILMNLLSNAVRYTRTGRVRFTVRYASETAIFTIEDTGPGIEPSEMDRIFRPFERIEDPDDPVRGTGLGLTITKLLTEMLGGDLAVESTPGEGSRFTVRLMLPRPAGGHDPLEAGEALSPARITGYRGRRQRVMVVDDNPEHRDLVADTLRPLGFEVVPGESATVAAAMLDAVTPDLVLLDVAMPGMDGWTFLRHLRETLDRKIPVFMVSAHAYQRGVPENAGPLHDAFITKPIKIDDLIRRIGRALDLVWRHDGGGDGPGTTGAARPPDDLLLTLSEAAAINHAAGVRAALDRIAAADPAFAPFVAQAEAALAAFNFTAIARLSVLETNA